MFGLFLGCSLTFFIFPLFLFFFSLLLSLYIIVRQPKHAPSTIGQFINSLEPIRKISCMLPKLGIQLFLSYSIILLLTIVWIHHRILSDESDIEQFVRLLSILINSSLFYPSLIGISLLSSSGCLVSLIEAPFQQLSYHTSTFYALVEDCWKFAYFFVVILLYVFAFS